VLKDFELIELTQLLSPEAPTWNGSCGFCLEVKKDYDRIFRVQQIKMHAGVGTHMDAPSHRFPEGISIHQIPLDQLIAPLCVLDLSEQMRADLAISAKDVQDYETGYGKIPAGALVIGYTGWSRFWDNKAAYRNEDRNGQIHFPCFTADAAELLLERNIAGLGIDTLSPDCLDPSFPVHKLILGAGKYIIENVASCAKLPAKGAFALALPLYAEGCTEAAVRLIALKPTSSR
jgi:kynurenine formamidase